MRILITGAAGAIGEAIARALRARHPQAVLTLSDILPLEGLAAELSGGILAADLSTSEGVEALLEAAGEVDLLVNCAGVERLRSLANEEWSTMARVIQIDLLAPLRLMQACAVGMRARGWGQIVNVASMAGVTPTRGMGAYGASKAGLAMASEIARMELASEGVQVLTVYPGPVRSAMNVRATAELAEGWFNRFIPTGEAQPLARRVVRALDKRRARVIYPDLYRLGWRMPALGRGLSQLSPGPAR